MTARHYRAPGALDRHVMNPVVRGLARLGVSVWGCRILEVPGRKSGKPRRVPVNLLTVDGARYLVAPRGETHWVRNLRAAGCRGTLAVGSRSEPFRARELADEEKEPVLREYLRRWKWESGQFFDGVGADSPRAEVGRIAPRHPVFRLES